MTKRLRESDLYDRPTKKAKRSPNLETNYMNKVLPNLYIGSIESRQEVTSKEIKHVFSFLSPSTSRLYNKIDIDTLIELMMIGTPN